MQERFEAGSELGGLSSVSWRALCVSHVGVRLRLSREGGTPKFSALIAKLFDHFTGQEDIGPDRHGQADQTSTSYWPWQRFAFQSQYLPQSKAWIFK